MPSVKRTPVYMAFIDGKPDLCTIRSTRTHSKLAAKLWHNGYKTKQVIKRVILEYDLP